jgi:hypothetical protein
MDVGSAQKSSQSGSLRKRKEAVSQGKQVKQHEARGQEEKVSPSASSSDSSSSSGSSTSSSSSESSASSSAAAGDQTQKCVTSNNGVRGSSSGINDKGLSVAPVPKQKPGRKKLSTPKTVGSRDTADSDVPSKLKSSHGAASLDTNTSSASDCKGTCTSGIQSSSHASVAKTAGEDGPVKRKRDTISSESSGKRRCEDDGQDASNAMSGVGAKCPMLEVDSGSRHLNSNTAPSRESSTFSQLQLAGSASIDLE